MKSPVVLIRLNPLTPSRSAPDKSEANTSIVLHSVNEPVVAKNSELKLTSAISTELETNLVVDTAVVAPGSTSACKAD